MTGIDDNASGLAPGSAGLDRLESRAYIDPYIVFI